jgi:hypothetical protein
MEAEELIEAGKLVAKGASVTRKLHRMFISWGLTPLVAWLPAVDIIAILIAIICTISYYMARHEHHAEIARAAAPPPLPSPKLFLQALAKTNIKATFSGDNVLITDANGKSADASDLFRAYTSGELSLNGVVNETWNRLHGF